MPDDQQLTRFRSLIRAKLKHENSRPFTCTGSPYECSVFIVGLNSATALGQPFFDRYWSDSQGFLRDVFERDYLAVRNKRGVRPRIEAIVQGASPASCLETNIYVVPTKKASQLRPEDKDSAIFELLLEEIRPRVVFLHSNEPISYFDRHSKGMDICMDEPVEVSIYGHTTYAIGWPGPLFSRKIDDAQRLGRLIGEYAARLNR